jgi:hypothetical protein
MQINPSVLDHLVASELAQLRHEESTLECTFEQLSSRDTDPTLQSRFLSMLADVEVRAARLEHILDHMEGSYRHSSYGPLPGDRVQSLRLTGGPQ